MAASLLLLAGTASAQSRPDGPANSAPQNRIIPLEATVNGTKSGTWPFVEQNGMLYAPREALEEWRVVLRAQVQPLTVRGAVYLPLAAVPGFTYKVSYSTQAIDIAFAPDAFEATRIVTKSGERRVVNAVLPSAFANYEINYAISRAKGRPSTDDVGALVELGGSTQLGVLTSSFVGRNLKGGGTDRSGWKRLETVFTRNSPQDNQTLRIGDAGTRVGLWGRSVYFGGIQWGTNFALTPGLLTQPVPVLTGVSSSPSTVELYEALIAQLDVPTALIEIEAMIIDITTDNARELGINWSGRIGKLGVEFGLPTVTPGEAAITLGGTFSAANFLISRLRLLQSRGEAEIKGRPSVLTAENLGALLDLSETFYIRVQGERVANVTPVTAGTTLRVTPFVVNEGGRILVRMKIDIEDGRITDNQIGSLPTVSHSAVSTEATVPQGEALLIAGYTSDHNIRSRQQVPVLGDLPWAGPLFSNTTRSIQKRERMFLIRPKVVSLPGIASESGSAMAPPVNDEPVRLAPSVSLSPLAKP